MMPCFQEKSVWTNVPESSSKVAIPAAIYRSALGPGPESAPRSAWCRKLLKKHCVGHFQARAPEHSCKWRPGSQVKSLSRDWYSSMGFLSFQDSLILAKKNDARKPLKIFFLACRSSRICILRCEIVVEVYSISPASRGS